MKCPKCGYLGFEHVERCRNCGYDFSLSSSAGIPELPIRPDARTPNPLDDLSLVDAALPPQPEPMSDAAPDLEVVLSRPPRPAATPPSGELPLFRTRLGDDDAPLITRPSPPRPPLAVRRATPEIARIRSEQPRVQTLDLALDAQENGAILSPVALDASASKRAWSPSQHRHAEDAGVAARFVAVAIDLLILAAIDAVVIYFTMQICGVTVDDLGILPKGPLLAFLLVQNGGYLVAFTAGGQTLGKMAAGIRVVSSDDDGSLDVGRALLRTVVWLVLAVPAGLGFLTAVLSRDHRGLHDRFAGTRVVR
jgi:uncharacterized RDD family membrane protein YckC